MRTQLTDDDIKGVLARAEEIYLRTSDTHDSDVVIRAAEEAGLPREAIEQALREQFELFHEPPKAGDLVFARSSDDHHYVAEVIAETVSGFKVRFLKGGEASMPLQALKPCSFLPGEEVTVNWPWWGWWQVSVVGYSDTSRQVQVTDGWNEEWFAMTDVRLDPPKKPGQVRKAMIWTYAAVIAGSGLLGAVVTWLVVR